MNALNDLLLKTFPYSPYYFSTWRILFGFFLLFYSVAVFPYAGTLYSDSGMYATYTVLPFFPNILGYYDGVALVYALATAAIACSLCIMLGYKRPICCVILWIITMSFFGRNILTEDPSLGFVVMLLVLLALVPSGEPFSLSKKTEKWYMPYFVYIAMLVTVGLGFSISGLDKLLGYGWQVGDAMFYLYNLELAYENYLVEFLRNSPAWSIKLQTWAAALTMLVALPALLARVTRPYMWLMLTGMYVLVLFMLDLKQVVFGVLLAELFLWDNRWIPKKKAGEAMLFYDTHCNLCLGYKNFIEAEDQMNSTSFSSIEDAPLSYMATSESIILVVDGKVYHRSDAVLEHMRLLGGMWRIIASIGGILPKKMRDAMYDYVGRHRYAWFGTCESERCNT